LDSKRPFDFLFQHEKSEKRQLRFNNTISSIHPSNLEFQKVVFSPIEIIEGTKIRQIEPEPLGLIWLVNEMKDFKNHINLHEP